MDTKWIIYTDLDGTLLDFTTYSFEVSAETVFQLKELNIPLIFCSSKTRVEQEVYRNALKLDTPFIVENGSAILIPENFFDFDPNVEEVSNYQINKSENYQAVLLGQSAAYVRTIIADAREKAGITPRGYADISIEEIMQLTGLSREAAQRAATRDYSETLLKGTTAGAEWDHFLHLLDQKGLQCVSGGKFHTVMGKGSDKGKAVSLLNNLLRKKYGEIQTVGLGDSANDLPLLAAVDLPFLVQKPSGKWQEVNDTRIKKVDAVGPAGFKLAIGTFLNL